MKKIILNEAQERAIIKLLLKPSGLADKQYPIHPEKVLIIKKFLDDGFKSGQRVELGPDGFPAVVPIVAMVDPPTKQTVMAQMHPEELVGMLNSRYPDMYSEKEHRERFFQKVVEDWFNNKITPYGNLSVNHL